MQNESLKKVVGEVVSICPNPAFVIDRDLSFLEYNDAMVKFTGYPKDEAMMIKLGDLFASNVSKREAALKGAIAAGKDLSIPNSDIRKKNGEIVVCSVRVKPMMDDNGEVFQALFFLDSSESISRLESKAYLYEQVLDSLPWPLSITDMDMNWLFINRPVENMLGVKRADVLGKQCSNWNANICKTKNCGIECLKANRPRTFFEQQKMNFQVDVNYIMDVKGEKMGHIEIVQDVTGQAREAAYRQDWIEQHKAHLMELGKGKLEFEPVLKEPDQYTRALHDMYVPIDASLVQARNAVRELVTDAEMLAKAAVEGKLDTRADPTRHQGDYRNVVQGVNDTLDAVIRPIEEAMRIADAYASGDLTVRVDIETQGDFSKFAASLDAIGESLTALLVEVNNSVGMVSSTSQELASSAEEMNASTEQVSSAIQQISKGAQSQASQVDETAKAMKEISSSVQEAYTKSMVASEAAKKANDSANAGRDTVENTIKKMQEIQKVVIESAKVIESLGKRSEEIGEIVSVITNISDQTNLLALNAAIEAARAGDQGRGFAVVAEEVKNLAEDSREAAERISKMIKEVQNETGRAVEAMHRGTKETAEGMQFVELTGKAFGDIQGLAATTTAGVIEISNLMNSQKEGTQRAARSVDGIASIAEETASASEESAASTEELTASMEDMTARAQALSEMSVNLQKIAGQFNIGASEAPAQSRAEAPRYAAPKKTMTMAKKAPSVAMKAEARMPTKVKEALRKRGIEAEN